MKINNNQKTVLWDSADVCLILMDYQDEMFSGVGSSSTDEIESQIRMLVEAAQNVGVPIILSTIGVNLGVNEPTRTSISDLIPDVVPIDRSSMNAWEDSAFRDAVVATGKRRLIMAGLWTEICLAFPVVDFLARDYEVMIPVDAVGGLTKLAHETAIARMIQAGAVPNTSLAIVTELFRDWSSDRATILRPVFNSYFRREHSIN